MITYWSYENEDGEVDMLGGHDYYGDYDKFKAEFIPSNIRGCDYVTIESADLGEDKIYEEYHND